MLYLICIASGWALAHVPQARWQALETKLVALIAKARGK
jgi:hypothetical protein